MKSLAIAPEAIVSPRRRADWHRALEYASSSSTSTSHWGFRRLEDVHWQDEARDYLANLADQEAAGGDVEPQD